MAKLDTIFTLKELASGRPNPEAIAAFLRGDEVITPALRVWLADLLDPASVGADKFVLAARRGAPTNPLKHEAAFDDFWARNDPRNPDRVNRKTAIDATCAKFKISASTLEAAIQGFTEMHRIEAANRPDSERKKGTPGK